MTYYSIPNVIVFSNTKVVPITKGSDEIVGHLTRPKQTPFERHASFRFERFDQTVARTIGILENGWKRLWITEYGIQTAKQQVYLKEKAGHHLLYFCIEGRLGSDTIQISENWSGQLDVTFNQTKIAYIELSHNKQHIIFHFHQLINENHPFFAFILCAPYFYRIYKKEHDFMEEWVEEITSS
ncbi:hypothetical protein IRY55_06715 [Savagea sp. SN6]|uniref:Uncharacterized protein n=1 Tax=Savagea serpentis TaxID=2785297 RepID=A0A8J7GLE6_9BACL|nr:hypothetical protein [Savagea serpentis]MBF4501053.1 hypothetical protein [Savagea serpentis]